MLKGVYLKQTFYGRFPLLKYSFINNIKIVFFQHRPLRFTPSLSKLYDKQHACLHDIFIKFNGKLIVLTYKLFFFGNGSVFKNITRKN